MALSDVLAKPNIKKVFLVEVTAGQHLNHWTLDTGSTYYATSSHEVIDVKEDGTSLTEQASIADVRSNAGSWYHDTATDRVYVHATAGANPYTKTLQAMCQFYFANHPKIFNGKYYEPYVTSVPNLSLRIERRFSGISQIGGGALTMINNNGHFDSLTDLQWDSGEVTLRLGADTAQTEMVYADYQTIGKWLTKNWSKDDIKFTLTLVEFKIKIKKKIPTAVYDTATYAAIHEDDIGKSIPIAYGVIKDATPALIDVAGIKFKVAGHSIISFDEVRIKNETNGAWEAKTLATTDIANGEFTLSGSDWDNADTEVVVDFTGKPKSGTVVMNNASDIIKDLLETYLLEPAANIDAASFTNAYNALDYGADDDGNRATRGKLGIYIDKVETVETTVEAINLTIGSYLFADSAGKFIYKVFEPVVGEGLTEFTDKDIYSFSEVTDNNAIISKVHVQYNKRLTTNWYQSYVYEVTERQHLHGEHAPALKSKEVPLSDTDDAKAWAQSQINYEGRPQKTYKVTVPGRKVMTMFPGDFAILNYARHAINSVFEIMAISHNLIGDRATLTLMDSHGLGDSAGFWVDAAATLPSRFSALAGYGAGSLVWNDAWDDEIKQWARQNVGYWTDGNGFASPTDPDSLLCSTWI